MSNFKFTEAERRDIDMILDGVSEYNYKNSNEEAIDRIEQIINERPDGWISVDKMLPENKWYIVCTNRPEGHPRKVIEAFYDGGQHNLWLDANGDMPEGEFVTHYMDKPSPPKQ